MKESKITKEELNKVIINLKEKKVPNVYQALTNPSKNDLYLLDIKERILKTTSFLGDGKVSMAERIYCISNEIKDKVLCRFCNEKRVTFESEIKGYKSCSNIECLKKSRHEANVNKYGEDYIMQFRDKHKKSFIDKYGVENPSELDWVVKKRELIKDERYGIGREELYIKSSKSLRETYADKEKSEEIRNKREQTALNKYGDTHFLKTEEGKKVVSGNSRNYQTIKLNKDILQCI